MENKFTNNIRLGVFVLAGLLFLILLLYMIGTNRNMFGSNFRLRARFENIQGLKSGNNVRFAGIDAGTVEHINIINDTVIEIVMILNKKVKNVIRKNAIVSIGTDGLVGNKVVNIISVKGFSNVVVDGDLLRSRKPVDTDEMMRTLYKTNQDAGIIAENLKTTIQQINKSKSLWETLNDPKTPEKINATLSNIRESSRKLNMAMTSANDILFTIKNGKGVIATLINDTSISENIKHASVNLKEITHKTDSVVISGKKILNNLQHDLNAGPGSIHDLLKDSLLADKLSQSLDNVEKGTDGFNQNMEALKHNFLFRGYFRKLEKQKVKKASGKP